MPVMRSVFYVPSNIEKMVGKAPIIAADVLTLDLEDSVPPSEKAKGREMIQQYLKGDRAKAGCALLVRTYQQLGNRDDQ